MYWPLSSGGSPFGQGGSAHVGNVSTGLSEMGLYPLQSRPPPLACVGGGDANKQVSAKLSETLISAEATDDCFILMASLSPTPLRKVRGRVSRNEYRVDDPPLGTRLLQRMPSAPATRSQPPVARGVHD